MTQTKQVLMLPQEHELIELKVHYHCRYPEIHLNLIVQEDLVIAHLSGGTFYTDPAVQVIGNANTDRRAAAAEAQILAIKTVYSIHEAIAEKRIAENEAQPIHEIQGRLRQERMNHALLDTKPRAQVETPPPPPGEPAVALPAAKQEGAIPTPTTPTQETAIPVQESIVNPGGAPDRTSIDVETKVRIMLTKKGMYLPDLIEKSGDSVPGMLAAMKGRGITAMTSDQLRKKINENSDKQITKVKRETVIRYFWGSEVQEYLLKRITAEELANYYTDAHYKASLLNVSDDVASGFKQPNQQTKAPVAATATPVPSPGNEPVVKTVIPTAAPVETTKEHEQEEEQEQELDNSDSNEAAANADEINDTAEQRLRNYLSVPHPFLDEERYGKAVINAYEKITEVRSFDDEVYQEMASDLFLTKYADIQTLISYSSEEWVEQLIVLIDAYNLEKLS